MIKPGRVSDGLFDLMDLFNTSLALGGIEDKIPTERYIDGVDQTGFLFADDGETSRQAVFSYNQADFSALRWGEFKAYFKVIQFDQPFSNISMSTYAPVGSCPLDLRYLSRSQGAPDPEQRRLRMDLRSQFSNSRPLTPLPSLSIRKRISDWE